MGSVIGSCAGSAAGSLICGACKSCMTVQRGPLSRIPYVFLFFISGIFAIFMSLYGEKHLNLHFYDFYICHSGNCAGNGSVYRVSFCLFLFELIHVVIVYFGGIQFHTMWFPMKFLLFAIALTITFLIDNSNGFFNAYADDFARFVSAAYLLLQILILISCGYDFSDYLKDRGDEYQVLHDNDLEESKINKNPWYWALAIGSVIIYILCFVFYGLFYHWYAAGVECQTHNTLITISLIFCILNGIISGVRGDGSFLVSSIVGFYCTFLLFAAIQSDPNKECNSFAHNRNTVSLWIGYIINFAAIFYTAFRTSAMIKILDEPSDEESILANDKQKSLVVNKNNDELDSNSNQMNHENFNDHSNYDNYDDALDSDEKKQMNEEQQTLEKQDNIHFHLVMMFASCYMAMLFTNWGTNSSTISTQSTVSLWVNMGCQYITLILFWWTLIAPVCFPSRFYLSSTSIY